MKRVFLLDPMLGTGGTSSLAISLLIESGVPEEKITFINLISCPEGIDRLQREYPKLTIITAVCDP